MTVIVETPATPDVAPPFGGRFRWAAAGCLVAGGLLQVAEFLLEPASDSEVQRVQWWLAHPGQLALSQAAGLLAIPFLVASFLVMYRLARDASRKVMLAATSMMVCAMVGLAAIHGVEQAASWVARAGDQSAAVTILTGDDVGLAGYVLLVMFLPMAAIGSLLLAFGMWRSRLVPRVAVILLLLFALLDFAGGLSILSHVSGLAADVVLAWAVVTGYVRRRRTGPAQAAH